MAFPHFRWVKPGKFREIKPARKPSFNPSKQGLEETNFSHFPILFNLFNLTSWKLIPPEAIAINPKN